MLTCSDPSIASTAGLIGVTSSAMLPFGDSIDDSAMDGLPADMPEAEASDGPPLLIM